MSCLHTTGAVAIAITTKRCLDFKDRRVTYSYQLGWGLFGWLMGFALASYYASISQLGDYKTLYCGARDNTRYDVSIPVFVVFGCCMITMIYYYRLALHKVTKTITSHNATNNSITSTVNKTNKVMSPRTDHSSNRAERVISSFSIKMCLAYYGSWAPVSIVAMLDTGKFTTYPLFLDIAAGWCIKLGCLATSYIVLALLKNIYESTQERTFRTAHSLQSNSLIDTGDDQIQVKSAMVNNLYQSDHTLSPRDSRQRSAAASMIVTPFGSRRPTYDKPSFVTPLQLL